MPGDNILRKSEKKECNQIQKTNTWYSFLNRWETFFGNVIKFTPHSWSGSNYLRLGATISLGLDVRALRLATAVFAALRGQRVSLWLPLNFGCNEHTDRFEQPTSGKTYLFQRNLVETEFDKSTIPRKSVFANSPNIGLPWGVLIPQTSACDGGFLLVF